MTFEVIAREFFELKRTEWKNAKHTSQLCERAIAILDEARAIGDNLQHETLVPDDESAES